MTAITRPIESPFAVKCADGQPCLATTTGCLPGQCSRQRTTHNPDGSITVAAARIESPKDFDRLRMSAESLACLDCGKLYADFPLDTTLPDEQWRLIHDSEGGVLCAGCMVARAAKLPGAVAVRMHIEFSLGRKSL